MLPFRLFCANFATSRRGCWRKAPSSGCWRRRSLGGCGPVEYINQVSFKAASALAAAKEVQADRYAPYEYTAAEAYLHKAREEAAYAQYQDSIEYGRKAEEQAHRARAIALSHMMRS